MIYMYRFAGDRQPKQPVPPGDSAFFYHGECVVNSAISAPIPQRPTMRQLEDSVAFGLAAFLASFTVTSHTCNLNICLGGGGFNCIAFYSGTSFVFDLGEQISRSNPKQPTRSPTRNPAPAPNPAPVPMPVPVPAQQVVAQQGGGGGTLITGLGDALTPGITLADLLGDFGSVLVANPTPAPNPARRQLNQIPDMPEPLNGEIKLPPPFPSTIIGGTGRYVQFKV